MMHNKKEGWGSYIYQGALYVGGIATALCGMGCTSTPDYVALKQKTLTVAEKIDPTPGDRRFTERDLSEIVSDTLKTAFVEDHRLGKAPKDEKGIDGPEYGPRKYMVSQRSFDNYFKVLGYNDGDRITEDDLTAKLKAIDADVVALLESYAGTRLGDLREMLKQHGVLQLDVKKLGQKAVKPGEKPSYTILYSTQDGLDKAVLRYGDRNLTAERVNDLDPDTRGLLYLEAGGRFAKRKLRRTLNQGGTVKLELAPQKQEKKPEPKKEQEKPKP